MKKYLGACILLSLVLSGCNHDNIEDEFKVMFGSYQENTGIGQTEESANSDEVMVVDAKVKVYEGTYMEETGLFDANLEGKTLTYYCIQTTNSTINYFDFQIIAVPVDNGNVRDDMSTVFKEGTAHFIEDGKKAVYHGDSEDLYFLFGDDQVEPTLGKMQIEGLEELEGKVYINNSIPGHEAG